jgi:DNA-binding GntR family transcriptional regulator
LFFVDNLQSTSYDPFQPNPGERRQQAGTLMPHATSKRPADASTAIEVLREHSLATLAQQELERRIISGEIPAGSKLNEVEMAGALGISRGPVREAFSALAQAGLVRVEKNRGVFVRQVSLEEANEFYEVRAALEGLIGKLAARRISIDEIEQLRGVVRRMHQVQKSRRVDEYFALNVEFHDVLARAARNNALLAHYRGVVNQLDLYRRATISHGVENIPLSTVEHEAIVDAVAARDEARAESLLTSHVLVSRSRLHAALGSSGAKT